MHTGPIAHLVCYSYMGDKVVGSTCLYFYSEMRAASGFIEIVSQLNYEKLLYAVIVLYAEEIGHGFSP